MKTMRYGPDGGQEGDLYRPTQSAPAVVCLLHGGFWRMPYGRDQFHAVAEDLAQHGFAVWNLEYRRRGVADGGWPGTFDDVSVGIDHLAQLAANGVDLDLTRVAVVGHSAGGHLALWSTARQSADREQGLAPRVSIAAAIGLAPIADLVQAHALGLGNGAAAELLGGSPDDYPGRYRLASPQLMLPLRVRQLVMHGANDSAVPIAMARDYTRAASAAGDAIELIELPDTGHMEFLDPASAAHAAFCDWLTQWRGSKISE